MDYKIIGKKEIHEFILNDKYINRGKGRDFIIVKYQGPLLSVKRVAELENHNFAAILERIG